MLILYVMYYTRYTTFSSRSTAVPLEYHDKKSVCTYHSVCCRYSICLLNSGRGAWSKRRGSSVRARASLLLYEGEKRRGFNYFEPPPSTRIHTAVYF